MTVVTQGLVVAGVVVVLIPVYMVYTELYRVLWDKATPFAHFAFMERPRAGGGYLALFVGILTSIVWAAIRLGITTRSDRHRQATAGAVSREFLWINVSNLVVHVSRITERPSLIQGRPSSLNLTSFSLPYKQHICHRYKSPLSSWLGQCPS